MTLDAVKKVLKEKLGYPGHLIDDQAEWIFENYTNELSHLRLSVFSHVLGLLSKIKSEGAVK